MFGTTKKQTMNTPTPRTDEQINGKPCTRFEVLGGDSLRDAYVPSQFARTLERDLTAVTEQRDEARRLAEKYRYLSCESQEEADAEVLPWENNQQTER
jgi:hypothetical protein